MYFKDISTGEVFETQDPKQSNWIEITEEEFIAAGLPPEIEISPDGVKNTGGNVVGKDGAVTTLELNAADGSAMFAAGAATISASGLVMSKSEVRVANDAGNVGIVKTDQSAWIVKLNATSLTWTNGNIYPATGRPTFNSSTGATLADLAGYQPKLNYTPVQQGTGVDQLTNVVKIGWGDQTKYAGRVRITIDTTDMGNIVTDGYLGNGSLNIFGLTLASKGLVTGTHIVVNGVKDWGVGRLGSAFVHATYLRSLAKDSGFDMDSKDRPLIEGITGDNRVAVLQDITNTLGSKMASGSINTNIGLCSIAGYTDNAARIGYLRLTTPNLQAAYDVTYAGSPIAIAAALGLTPPSASGKLIVSDVGSFCNRLASGAEAICDWGASVTGALTQSTWNMRVYSSKNDGARNVQFSFAIMYQF